MRSKIFPIRVQPIEIDFALLLIRIICGYAFMLHGFGKIQNPFHWMGDQAPVPGILQGLAAFSEFGGGLCWVLGLLTRIGSFGIFCTMAVAATMHRFVMGDPFVNLTGKGSYEPALVYLLISFLLIVMGAGRFSLDRIFFGTRN